MTRPADGIFSLRVDQVILGSPKVTPDGADSIPITSEVTDWTQGALTQIIAASAITTPFVLTGLIAILVGADYGQYQLDLYYGAGDTFLASIRYVFYAGELKAERDIHIGVAGGPIPANSRIRGRLRYEDATASGAGTNGVAFEYVEGIDP